MSPDLSDLRTSRQQEACSALESSVPMELQGHDSHSQGVQGPGGMCKSWSRGAVQKTQQARLGHHGAAAALEPLCLCAQS